MSYNTIDRRTLPSRRVTVMLPALERELLATIGTNDAKEIPCGGINQASRSVTVACWFRSHKLIGKTRCGNGKLYAWVEGKKGEGA